MNSRNQPLNRPLSKKESNQAAKRRPIVLKMSDLERIVLNGQKNLPAGITLVVSFTATGISVGYTEERLAPLDPLDDLTKLQSATRILKKSESITASSQRAKGILVLAAQNVPEDQDTDINFGPSGTQTINDIGLESQTLKENVENFFRKATPGFLGNELTNFIRSQAVKIASMQQERIALAALGKPKPSLDELREKHGVHSWTYAKLVTRNFIDDDPQTDPSLLFFPKKIGNSIATSIREWENPSIASDLELIVKEKLSRQLLSPRLRIQFFEIPEERWSDMQKESFYKRKFPAFPPYGAAQNCATKRSVLLLKDDLAMPFAPFLQAYNMLQRTACGQVPRHVDSKRYWDTIHGVAISTASGSAIPDLVGRFVNSNPGHKGPFDKLLFDGMDAAELQQYLDTSFNFKIAEDTERFLKPKAQPAPAAGTAGSAMASATPSDSSGISDPSGSGIAVPIVDFATAIKKITVPRKQDMKVIISEDLSERMKLNPAIWAIKTKARKENKALARTPLSDKHMKLFTMIGRAESAYFHDAAPDIINLLQSFKSKKLQNIACDVIVATMQADPKNDLFYNQAGSEIQMEPSDEEFDENDY